MDSVTLKSCLTSIEQTFEQEAAFIVSGEIAELGALSHTKLAHLESLSTAIEGGALRGQPESLIRRVLRLQSTAVEHDQHLQAMRHGLTRIRERIDRLQSDAQVGSYNQYGTRVQFSGARGRFESKA